MFSVGGITPQVILPVQHLVAALHSLKTLAEIRPSVLQRNGQCRKNTAQTTTSCKHSHISASVSKLLEECNLTYLPESWSQEILPQVVKHLHSQEETGWSTSYVSAETFFENKHGFTAADLHKCQPGYGAFSSHHMPLCHHLRHATNFQQRRGFKTMRSDNSNKTLSGRSRLRDEQMSVQSFFMNQLRSVLGLKKEHIKEQGINLGNNSLGSLVPDVQSAYNNLQVKGQQNEVRGHMNYDSFKSGYYDGYVTARQHGNEKGQESQGTPWNLYKMGLFALVLVLLVPSLLKTLADIGVSNPDMNVDTDEAASVTFDDVRGIAEAKAELEEIVEYLRNPEKLTKLGGKLPKGILLVGAPGTGKTLLARAVAGEAGVPFFYASGSDFDHMYVGSGAKKVREIFREAKLKAPSVIFIDELDSVGGKRVQSPNHPYARQTINQLLAEMDGFKKNEGVIVLGATNFPKALDSALTRPGRFDINVSVPLPDVNGRIEILDLYLGKVTIALDIDKEILARGIVGFTGADINNLVNQAALHAAKLDKDAVDMTDMEFAKDKILMGPERKSLIIDNKNKEITAFHEGGHALVAYFTKDSKPINKATIMPRGDSLGHVSLLPKKDQWSETKSQLLAQMDVCMGGRVAEEIMFGTDEVTTGAGSDFDQATRIARLMITRFGMSEKLGVMTMYAPDRFNNSEHSDATQSEIETEIRILLQESYNRATNLLRSRSKEHKLLAESLLKYETLSADEIELVINGKNLDSKQIAA